MIHKKLSIAAVLGLMIALAACGSPAATTAPQPSQPTSASTSEAAPPATQAATDQAPGGGLVPQGGAVGPDAITADNLDRLNTLVELKLPAFITSLSFSPDSKLLAVGTAKGGIIFDLASQQQVATFAQDTPLFGVVWSPDGKLLAGLPGDPTKGKITIWDVGANAESNLLSGKLDGQMAFAFSPDGSQAASGGASGVVTLWNLASSDAASSFNVTAAGADAGGGQAAVTSLAFIGGGKTLAVVVTGALTQTLLWDVSAGGPLPAPSPAQHVAGPGATGLFAPGDAGHIYWLSHQEIVGVDLSTDKETGKLTTEDIIQSTAFSPDGKLLAAASGGTQNGAVSPLVKLWNTVTGQDAKILTGLTQIPTAMAFSPDGSRLALGIVGEGIAVWGLVQNK